MDATSPPHVEREGTFRLPLTPPMKTFVRGTVGQTRRLALVALAVALVCVPVLFRAGYGAIGVLAILGVIGYGIYNETIGKQDARDTLATGTFNRYVGPLQVKEVRTYDLDDDAGGALISIHYDLTVPDYTFRLGQSAGQVLRNVPWGKVDYLDVSGIGQPEGLLLEVRDRDGRTVYRHPDYRTEKTA